MKIQRNKNNTYDITGIDQETFALFLYGLLQITPENGSIITETGERKNLDTDAALLYSSIELDLLK